MSSAKGKVRVSAMIDEDTRVRMLELGVSPSRALALGIALEIKRAEQRITLRAVQKLDPRVTVEDLQTDSERIRHLKRMASVSEPRIKI